MEHAETKSECPNHKTEQIWGSGKSLLMRTDHHNVTRRNFNLLQSAEGRLLVGDTTKLKDPEAADALSLPGSQGIFWDV